MELGQYLQELEKNDERSLIDEFGVYDNFDVVLDTDVSNVMKYFKDSNKWTYSGNYSFDHISVQAIARVYDGPIQQIIPDSLIKMNPEGYEQLRKKLKEGGYSCSVVFCPSSPFRKSVRAIIDFSREFVIADKIPSVYTSSVGQKHPFEFSRTVVYDSN